MGKWRVWHTQRFEAPSFQKSISHGFHAQRRTAFRRPEGNQYSLPLPLKTPQTSRGILTRETLNPLGGFGTDERACWEDVGGCEA